MPKRSERFLTKRQQEIMEVIYRHGEADVAIVMMEITDPLSNPAVRAHLRTLEEEGHLTHTELGGKFIYRPTKPRQAAAATALQGVLRTFFDDSLSQVMQTLISAKSAQIAPEELDRLQAIIDEARAEQGDTQAATVAVEE